jgi:hypothetical protein
MLESSAADEIVSRLVVEPKVAAALAQWGAKLVEIGGAAPRAVEAEVSGKGIGLRIDRIRCALRDESLTQFTVRSDREVVVRMFMDFARAVGNFVGSAMNALCGLTKYEGKYDIAGERDGPGTARWPDGDLYEGEWRAGKRAGTGTFTYSNGDVYAGGWRGNEKAGHGTYTFKSGERYEGGFKAGEKAGRGAARYPNGDSYRGEFEADKKHGKGTYFTSSGLASVTHFRADKQVDEGVMWSADLQTAWQLSGGEKQAEIALGEARALAGRIGLPIPAPAQRRGPTEL